MDDGEIQVSEKEIEGFEIKDDDEIESLKADVSEKALRYEELFIKEKATDEDRAFTKKAP